MDRAPRMPEHLREVAELRARLEDARREFLIRLETYELTGDDVDRADLVAIFDMILAHPAPAPASMRDLAPVLSVEAIGDGNAVVRFTDRSETLVPLGDKAPAQATCDQERNA